MKQAEKLSFKHADKFFVSRFENIKFARKQVVTWLMMIAILIGSIGVQLALVKPSFEVTAPIEGGTFAEAIVGQINTLNPLYATNDAERSIAELMFSSLYNYDETGIIHKDLVEDLAIDVSGKIYTIKLRPDIFWHDGEILTAKDVVFTVGLIKNPETFSSLRASWQDITARAVDDRTIEFVLPTKYGPFLQALTFPILPKHILGDIPAGSIRENTFSSSPTGSGPFEFSSVQSSGQDSSSKIVQMKAFDRYFAGRADLSRYEVHAYRDRDGAVKALRGGVVNSAFNIPVYMSADLAQSGFKVDSHSVDSGVYALFNVKKLPFDDVNVRRALQIATDTKALREKLPLEQIELSLPFVNRQLSGITVPKPPEVDRIKATELLNSAGWATVDGVRQKDGTKLEITITTTKDDFYEKTAEELALQWRKLGIVVNVSIIDPALPETNFVQSILQPRNFDVLIYELQIGSDPDVYAFWHSSQADSNGYNFSNYSNSTADAALVSARSRLEKDIRNSKYKTFAEIWLSDSPAIGLYQPTVLIASNKKTVALPDGAPLVSPPYHYANILDWSVKQKPVYQTP